MMKSFGKENAIYDNFKCQVALNVKLLACKKLKAKSYGPSVIKIYEATIKHEWPSGL